MRRFIVAAAVALTSCAGPIEPTLTTEPPDALHATAGEAAPPAPATVPSVRILGQTGSIFAGNLSPAEWTVEAEAGEAPLRIKTVNFYDPTPGSGPTTYPPEHRVPAAHGETEVTVPAGERRTIRFPLDPMRNGCGRQQVDLLVDYADGRGFQNRGWLILNTDKACAPPPSVVVAPWCPANPRDAFLSIDVKKVPGTADYLASYHVGALPVEVSFTAWAHVASGQKHPQDRTYLRTIVLAAHETKVVTIPAIRACDTQADVMVVCGQPVPMRYEASNAAWVDGRTAAWAYTGKCQ